MSLDGNIDSSIIKPSQTGEALREGEEKFRIAFENAPNGMSMITPDGHYLAVNPVLCEMFGYTREELLGGTIDIVTHPDDIERSRLWIQKVIAGDLSEPEFEKRYIHRDGHIVWGLVRAAWIRDADGSPRFSVVHIQDITERKRAEEERSRLEEQLRRAQKMEAIGLLAGGVAHDFNNLLTVIGGNAAMAIENLPPDHPLQTYLTQIGKAVESAANLTRQLLAFSRKQIIAPKVLNLNDVIVHLEYMLRRLLGENLNLDMMLDEQLGPACIDPNQFEQIIVNLAINARDAMPEGGKLTIETRNITLGPEYSKQHRAVSPGDYVMLAINDNGSGMSEDVKSRIFEPFFTTKEQGRGTGLGLAMVYGAVRQNHGHIEVHSEPDQGTTFKIYLPRVNGQPEALAAEIPPCLVTGTETIVLVEDDAMLRSLTERILSEQGYHVHEFPNGEEALRGVRDMECPIHLLLTDIVMPGMNGLALAENLKGLRPDIKVLFTSGYTQNVAVRHGVLAKDIEFIPKPYTIEALTTRVREVLDRTASTPLKPA